MFLGRLRHADTYRKAIQSIHSGERDVNKMLAEIDKSYDDNKSTVSEPSVK